MRAGLQNFRSWCNVRRSHKYQICTNAGPGLAVSVTTPSQFDFGADLVFRKGMNQGPGTDGKPLRVVSRF